jgi:hypothetical protein
MSNAELTAHQLDQDRLDQLEEDRLKPIYQAQREVLESFCEWLNDRHPNGAQFEVKPKGAKNWSDYKPYIDTFVDALECKGESDEIDIKDNDAWLILHNIYSLETSPK